MGAKKYTEDQICRAAELRERGLSLGQIAMRSGMTVSSVEYHCLRLGADSPNTRSNIDTDVGPMMVRRGDHTVRRFTVEEDQELLRLEANGLTYSEIGHRLNRKPNSIRGRLMTLARRADRMEGEPSRSQCIPLKQGDQK
ncbi:MAG: hypothetical protein ACP5DX_03980 [Paracoccaceae bacterium]